MTVAAVAGSAAWWAVTAAVVADAAIIAGSSYGAYSAYEQGKAAEQQAKAANEQEKAQASAYAAQASESERQAELERDRAGIAQIQGEREAERRSRALSAEIGSIYAATAGNGLLVDGNEDDTFASVVRSSVAEGQSDLTTIRDNTAISVWDHQANERALLAQAAIQRGAAANSIVSGQNSLIAGRNAAKTGKLNAIGTGLQGIGQLVGMGVSSYGTLAKTGSSINMSTMYDWNGSSFASYA